MRRLEASVHPEDWDLVRGAIERSARAGDFVNVEYRIVLPGDGRVRWIASRGRPRFTPTGEPDRLMGVSIDIGERKRAERGAAHERGPPGGGSRARRPRLLRGGFRRRHGLRRRPVPRPLRCSPRARTRASSPWSSGWNDLHPDDRSRVMDLRAAVARRQAGSALPRVPLPPPDPGADVDPAPGPRRRARRRWTDAVKSYGVLRDVTERKRVEDELRDLSRRLIRAHEEERALLARELHDDVSQRLAVLAIDVGRAELAAPDGAQAGTMQALREGLVRLSEDIHSLAYQLHPSVLEELGLAEALRAECERRGRQGPPRPHGRTSMRCRPSSRRTRRSVCSAWRRRR